MTKADRGRGLNVRHDDHFVVAEPEPMYEGLIGKVLARITKWLRR